MTRDEFKSVASQAVETVTSVAEQRLSRQLPRQYVLDWLGGPLIQHGEDIAELLTEKVFVSEDKIFPCVDLFLDDLREDGRLWIVCYRAAYEPCKFGEHWQYKTGGHDAGQVGPFRLGCRNIVSRLTSRPAG